MRQWGLAGLAVLALIGGHLHEAGAGSKWWKHRGCGGCAAPVSIGCSAPYSYGCSGPSFGCSAPYSFGCSAPVSFGCSAPVSFGCSAPVSFGCAGGCGLPMGYHPQYAMPWTGEPLYPQASCYAPTCGGCSTPVYGCAGGCARPEYSPYVYQPNPYANTWGVGAPIRTGAVVDPVYAHSAGPLLSAYQAHIAASLPSIPALPPAEDTAW